MESKEHSDEVVVEKRTSEDISRTNDDEADEDDDNTEKYDDDETEHVILDVSNSKGNTVISIQPHLKDQAEQRTALPITVGRSDRRGRQVVLPLSGLQLLYDVTRLRIQQVYDIHYLTSGLTSENRYVIRSGHGGEEEGDALLGCCETSASWQRLLCGTRRRFNLTLLDQTHQQAATFHRRLASSCPLLGLYLQRMDVYLPGGDYIGTVAQEWSSGYPNFSVRGANRETLYRIRANNCWTCSQTDFVFHVLNAEGTEVLSHISHEWNRDMVDYNLCVVMPLTDSIYSKTLIIAAAFLFEYMYFLPSKEGGWMASCCK